ncbi:alpha/beta hydrolase family protein [Candidatus Protochlamydia phocaeensis]|uniref:S9 family peptidase n=1 Tax=Candidatus Protochlamydia phocaeensis TaxID=1414722 RepID=UPI000838C9A7|nr:S9 family peptidase [Candidatus Protochlamydia phocaeensis]
MLNFSYVLSKLGKRHLGVFFSILFLFAEGMEAKENKNVQEKEPLLVWSCREMMKVKRVEDVQTSFDGQYVCFTVVRAQLEHGNHAYQRHLYIASVQQPGRCENLFNREMVSSPQWSPKGLQLAALVPDTNGYRQIWLIDLIGNSKKQLTYLPSDITGLKWSPDGEKIAFTASQFEEKHRQEPYAEALDARFTCLWLLEVNGSSKPSLLPLGRAHVTSFTPYMGGGGYDWSPNSQEIAVTLAPTVEVEGWKQSYIAIFDIAAWQIKKTINQQCASFSPVYSPDGKQIAYLAAYREAKWPIDFRAFIADTQENTSFRLATTMDAFPSKIIGWSADGRSIYVMENYRTNQAIIALSIDAKDAYVITPEGIAFSQVHWNASKGIFGLNSERLNEPPEAHLFYLADQRLQQVSQVNRECLAYSTALTSVLQWKSTDGIEIEGLLTYPIHYQKGKAYPLIIIVHGGPLGVFSQHFIASPSTYGPIAALAQAGYAVLRCNVRGSTGYGKTFRYANFQDWGGKDCDDLMQGIRHVIELGIADEKRLGIMGWSYGGYLTLCALSRTSQFKAAVVGAAISNCISFNGTTDVPGFLSDYFGSSLWQSPALYARFSPLFHLKAVSTPLLIQHGDKDRRVPIGQGDELYRLFKQKGGEVQMIVYSGMSHYPHDPQSMLDLLQSRITWFSRFIEAHASSEANFKEDKTHAKSSFRQ